MSESAAHRKQRLRATSASAGGLAALRRELRAAAQPARAKIMLRFFKTGPGEYAEGDRFIGASVPAIRSIARRYRALPLAIVTRLLRSPIHEERAIALFILVHQYRRGDEATRRKVYTLYLRHTRHINNWDLVDCSAEHIVGPWLAGRPGAVLERLARSQSLWERRIAILATFYYIKLGDYRPTLRVISMLLRDPHDLIHKASGWMLREIGSAICPPRNDSFSATPRSCRAPCCATRSRSSRKSNARLGYAGEYS